MVNKTKQKTLLILPCNSGAKAGNYFTQPLWKRIDKILKVEGLRNKVDLAAIDCIITFKKQDNKGALVSEFEMNRVKGYDVYPGSFFKKDTKKNFERLVIDTKIGLKRFEKKYNKIIVFVNVVPYRLSLIKPIKELNLLYKTTILDFPIVGYGISDSLIKYLIYYVNNTPKGIIKINDRKIYKWTSEKWRDYGLSIYNKSVKRFSELPSPNI